VPAASAPSCYHPHEVCDLCHHEPREEPGRPLPPKGIDVGKVLVEEPDRDCDHTKKYTRCSPGSAETLTGKECLCEQERRLGIPPEKCEHGIPLGLCKECHVHRVAEAMGGIPETDEGREPRLLGKAMVYDLDSICERLRQLEMWKATVETWDDGGAKAFLAIFRKAFKTNPAVLSMLDEFEKKYLA
jgi:hypothetical protein